MNPPAHPQPRWEVADIFRAHGEEYCRRYSPSPAQQKVMRHIQQCRTAALGGHREQCDQCGHQRIRYHSCRDRNCPKCQGIARHDWLEKRLATLLPIPYFHVVLTLPHQLNALALGNQTLLFNLLFASAAGTLRQVAATPRHLGADIGFTAVLHSGGQNLLFHPHLHCVVTGGGLAPDGRSWIAARERFFLPIQVLSALFRGKFLDALRQAYAAGHLKLAGSTAALSQPHPWRHFLDELYQKNWVVYAKPPFASPEFVFRYLGRYTHRVAISNQRILTVEDGQVTFTLKNYSAAGRREQMTVDAVEFIRRFLLHVLPPAFTRIRHFGLYAGRNVQTKLITARAVLAALPSAAPPPSASAVLMVLSPTTPPPSASAVLAALPPTVLPPPASPAAETDHRLWWQRLLDRTGIDPLACPCCRRGRLLRCGEVPPLPCHGLGRPDAWLLSHDTS